MLLWITLTKDSLNLTLNMKKLLVIIVLSLLVFQSPSQALNFYPISKYAKNNRDIVAQIYVLERCSALLIFIGNKMRPEKVETSKEKYNESKKLINYAVTKYQQHHNTNTSESVNNVMNKIELMVSLYKEDSDQMYIRNGHYISGIIKRDFDFCTALEGGL